MTLDYIIHLFSFDSVRITDPSGYVHYFFSVQDEIYDFKHPHITGSVLVICLS